MSSFQRVIIQTPGTAADFKSVCNLAMGGLDAAQNFENFVAATQGGNQMASYSFQVGAVKASATITSTGAATADETLTVLNVVFTAKNSGATGNQFNVSGTPATQAANIAAALNASSNLSGKVVATAALGVVTVTSVVPGLVGNGLQISDTLTNVTAAAFSGGSDGTSYTVNLL